ncbi:MAG: AAA family ATPase, partial [Candidatus Omnitrophica bacterium]|nr:AAA family ATPase [Candidatus Omnitrophota bacterium]
MNKINNTSKNGAIWLKGDLHLHSPLVKSFILPGSFDVNDKNLLITEYVNALKQKNISFAAITDYQQIRIPWFQNFQKAAEKENIVIFPGVELSITYGKGLHILLVFEFDEDLNGINDYIKSLDKNPQTPLIKNDRIHRDIDLQRNIKDILQEIKTKFNCLIIFPHPNDENGILKSLQPKEAAGLLKYADAIEYLDNSNKDRLISTNQLNNNFFEGFSIIENTDPKTLDEIGNKQRNGKTRATYYKLSNISINAIRTAFQDPQMRISIYEKPQYDYDRLNWIKVEGSKFLKSVEINFNKELNCLIGGRGVGKSAILESIRYCLKNPYYSEQSFREDFVSNVVGSGGKITLSVSRKMGDQIKEYTIERIIGKEPTVTNYQLMPSEIFEDSIPIIIGQKELYHLTNDKEYLLRLIDQLIGSEIKNEESLLVEKIYQLKDNAKKYLNIIE